MKALVTAIHADGRQWGWPGEPVYRYRGEDGSWAWVPQPPKKRYAVGDVIDADGGWEWLDEDAQAAKIAEHDRMSNRERREALLRAEAKAGHSTRKRSAQVKREVDAILTRRRPR